MTAIEIIGSVLLLGVLIWIVLIAVRRWSLARVGGIDICWRTRMSSDGRGWSYGQGRYTDRGLIVYRSFSPLPFPSLTLQRDRLQLGARRAGVGAEPDLLPVGAAIVECDNGGSKLELAISEEALTGLRSWLESSPRWAGSIRTDGPY